MVEISRMFWKRAFSSDGFFIGEIQSAELNMSTWQITNFYVGLSDEATMAMGFKRPWMGKVTVCLPVSVIESFEDTVKLNETKEKLLNLKQCKE